MARSYEDVVAPLRGTDDLQLADFAKAAEAHFDAAYRLTFGVGEQLAARRAELHLSQAELAERTGIPQPEISRIERGKGNPTLSTLEKLLRCLRLDLDLRPRMH